MEKNKISIEDVLTVAHSLGMSDLTIAELEAVKNMYDEDSDPTGTWNLIVENDLYNVIQSRELLSSNRAKKVLKDAGYFTDNLWHVDDVKLRFAVTDDEDAQDILDTSLTNEWMIEQIHYVIGETAIAKGFKEIEE